MKFIVVSFSSALLILSASIPALAQAPSPDTLKQTKFPVLKEIDLYGTSQITVEQIRSKLGAEIQSMFEAYSKKETQVYNSLKKRLEDDISKMGKFAYVNISLIRYFAEDQPVYITIDTVDEKDKNTRMNFIPIPTKELPDPDGLFQLWKEYENAGTDLMSKGELSFNWDTDPCPAFHCLWGFTHPQFKKYEKIFVEGAEKNRPLLINIVENEKNPQHRAWAVFLLAHIKDLDLLVSKLLPLMRDASHLVRNNVMRVLSYIAHIKKGERIPLARVMESINYPNVTDRNKALSILSSLAELPGNQKKVIRQGGFTLLKLLRLAQPNNHEAAFSILKKISGRSYKERDYKSWELWLTSNQ